MDDTQGRMVTYKFAQHARTILPRLEDELFEERQSVKREMKTEKDPFKYSLLDSRQVSFFCHCIELGLRSFTVGD